MTKFANHIDMTHCSINNARLGTDTVIEAQTELPTGGEPGQIFVKAELFSPYKIVYKLYFHNGIDWMQVA